MAGEAPAGVDPAAGGAGPGIGWRGLADKHDPSRLEAACAKAIAAGDPSYRTVKGILAAGAERDQIPATAGDGGAAAFLRGPASFANVIPLPGTMPSDAVRPENTTEVTS